MDLDRELAELLKRFHIEVTCWFKEVFRQAFFKEANLDLTQAQYRILRRIKHNQPCKMGELSGFMNVSFGSMTIMVNKLVEEGLVKRETSTEDRRVILVSLTEKGEKTLRQFQSEFLDFLKNRLSLLDENKKKKLYSLLEELLKIIPDI